MAPIVPAVAPARGTCLVVTGLALDDLAASRHGIYQRFRMLTEAMAQTGLALELICAQGKVISADAPQACAAVEAEILKHWGIACRVLALTHTVQDIRTPFLLQQIGACVSHTWGPGFRAAKAGGQLQQLQSALDRRPNVVFAHRLANMARLLACRGVPPCVFDMDDIEHVVHARRMGLNARWRDRWLARAALPALLRLERAAVQKAALTLVCAAGDASTLKGIANVGDERVAVVPNGVTPAPSEPDPAMAGPVLLMLGIYSYEPNGEGARHFIDRVWPIVREALPEAQAWFVGASPASIGAQADMPAGVKLLGFVDDIEAVYAQAGVVICPILTGGGTRVKLIEAAMRHKPIVSTTVGAEGLGFTDGRHALLRDDVAGFAQACIRLLTQPSEARAMGLEASRFAAGRYDRRSISQALAERVRALLPRD